MTGSIVVAVDDSDEAHSAAQLGAALAHAFQRRLVLAHAAERLSPLLYGDANAEHTENRRALWHGNRVVDRVAATVHGKVDARVVRVGPAAQVLPATCEDQNGELLVVGTRGRGPKRAVLLGSLSSQLIPESKCPVVVASPQGAAEYLARARMTGGSIICGIDGSQGSMRALEFATRLAGLLELDVQQVHADPDAVWSDALRDHLSPLDTEIGIPADALRRRAARNGGRLLVVGSRGHGRWRKALLGSVSAELAASAPVPVVVVPLSARIDGPAPARSRALVGAATA